ncbi:UvrD-helicase domain-containing protein [Candidatus Nitrosopelagicus sp.]|nr:UvrD-helicase domain-containing protein [Candidatus Nitrosopelagicus sp.]
MTESTKLEPSAEQQAIIDSKVDTIVVSNPGTGKTTTLSQKVIDLLENGVNPENILCITFTAKAKKEMFDKIFDDAQGKFPDADIMKIRIHTFHGFAYDYLTEIGLMSAEIVGNNLLRYSILESFIENKAFNYGKPYIIDTLMPKVENAIRYIKSFGITPDKIDVQKTASVIQQQLMLIEKNKGSKTSYTKEELIAFLSYFVDAYKHYEDSKNDTIDYSDMLLTFIEKFQGDKFEHVLVDEMQDMNEIEAQIVEMISKNLFLVGDAKQAIFGFQGGSIKNFEKFAKTCKLLFLSTNYRSTQQILDYSKQFFLDGTQHKTKFEKELEKFNGVSKGSLPKIFATGAPFGKIISLIEENPGKSIGVITRTNRQIIEVSKYLDNHSIDYTTTSSQATTKEARNEIITYLKGLLSGDINQKISATFTTFSPYTLQEAFEFSNDAKKDSSGRLEKLNSWKINLNKEELDKLFTEELYPLCVSKGSEWFSTAVTVKEQIDEYLAFETPTFEGLFDFIAIGEESYTERNKKSTITLTTVHKAKGRGFDIVIYVPSHGGGRTSFIDIITESVFIAKGINLEDEVVEESLRIDFVAMTRAKEKLFIISEDEQFAARFHHQGLSKIEVDEEEEEKISTSTISNRLAEAYSLFVDGRWDDSKKLLESKETWLKEFIYSYFQNVEHFSYSSVTKVPYDFLSKNIIKKPYGSQALNFGSNVHNALEKIVSGKAKVEDYTDEDEVKAIKNGLERLEKLKKENPGFKIKATEMNVKVPIKSLTEYTETDNLMFKGFIDAVFEHDGGIFLVDYKTDKNTNYASHHKRQLAVYKKMYSKLEGIPEEKIETCIIFVALRGGINTGKSDSGVDFGKRNVFGTFEQHLQKVLEWKKDPEIFINELLEQSTQDSLHEAIKEKLAGTN